MHMYDVLRGLLVFYLWFDILYFGEEVWRNVRDFGFNLAQKYIHAKVDQTDPNRIIYQPFFDAGCHVSSRNFIH